MPGPTTVETSALALGLAQIRIGVSVDNIANIHPALSDSDSIGSMTETKFIGEKEFWKHESGFPLLEDHSICLREKARVEIGAEEMTPANIALARGIDPATYTLAHSGEIKLGALTDLDFLRAETVYTFPDTDYTMQIVFPRAQVEGTTELALQKEDAVAIPMAIESKRANSGVSGGNAAWDDMPLGRIVFLDASS